MSATIRNPEDLHIWLQNAEHQKKDHDIKNNTARRNSPKSYEVALVIYNERYNDLEKFNYIAATDATGSGRLNHIHPCAVLTYRQLCHSGQFPSHISLSPREYLAFYDAMVECWPEKDTMKPLCPERYFQEKGFISKQDARQYEDELKSEFLTWIADRQKFEMVISILGGSLDASPRNESSVVKNVCSLVNELEKDDKLRVIFFSYRRNLCEHLTFEMVRYLMQKNTRSASVPSKQQEKRALKKTKLIKRIRDKRSLTVDEEEKTFMRKTNSAGHNPDLYRQPRRRAKEEHCFLLDKPPLGSCSFANPGVLDREDAQAITWKLERSTNMSLFKAGLRRGISFHHAGMSTAQRRVVEMLFRKKFLQILFATGTLALGIHMPCKTVVFAGDSVYLNSLRYHQISGRAGRRGFDLIGNVVFLGVPAAKIQRLMSVNLPKIIGNFPLSVTLVLRLLLIVNKADDAEIVMNQVLTLLQNPLICRDQPELDLQLKHHFLFSVEMLVRQVCATV